MALNFYLGLAVFVEDPSTPFRNPTRLLPKIKHTFPRQSLRYRLIVTLNETSDDILEMATTQLQKYFIKFIRERIVVDYSYTCNLVICRICDGR